MPGYRSIWTYLNTVPHQLAFLERATRGDGQTDPFV